MAKYTVVVDGVEKIYNISKHHTAVDFMDEVFKWVGRGVTVGTIYHWYTDDKGNEKAQKVR